MTAPTQPTTLAAWLEQCVAADEAVALAAAGRNWKVGSAYMGGANIDDVDAGHSVVMDREDSCTDTETATHIARHDPARALREVAFHRDTIQRHHGRHFCHGPQGFGEYGVDVETGYGDDDCPTLRSLASVYAGNEGWREEWA